MSKKIGDMNSHCGECGLINFCGDPFESPYLCAEKRFKSVNIDDYIKLAETSTVSLNYYNFFKQDINIDDFECLSDYEDAIEAFETNAFKALVADDVERRLKDR